MSSFTRTFATLLFLIGLLLIVINLSLYGLNDIEVIKADAQTSSAPSAKEAVAGYHYATRDHSTLQLLLEKPSDHFNIEEINTLIFESIMHSDQRKVQFQENWLLWLMGQIYQPFSRTQDAERIVAGGGAICSEVSRVLKHVAEINGFQSRFIGLSGHTLLEIKTKEGWRIVDPDYGVIYPVDRQGLEHKNGAVLIQERLQKKGYSTKEIKKYIHQFQTVNDNTIFDIEQRFESPRLYFVERTAEWLKWIIPIMFIIISLMIFRRNKKVQ